MNVNRAILRSLATVALVWICSNFASSQENSNSSPATTVWNDAKFYSVSDARSTDNTAGDLTDPVFEQFANPGLIALAISNRDAAPLADVALQWNRAEQVLGRSHRSGVAGDFLIKRAVSLAVQTGDEDTLARLSQAASALQDNTLNSQIEAIKRLDGIGRGDESEWTIDVRHVDAVTFGRVRQIHSLIQSAAFNGDVAQLQSLAMKIDAESLPDSAAKHLSTEVKNAIESVERIPDPSSQALIKLIAESRAICRKCMGAGRYVRGLNFVRCDRCNGSGAIPDKDSGYVGSWEMESSANPSQGDLEIDTQVKRRFEFTLWNGCENAIVGFRLGKLRTEQLSPGAKKSYSFVGNESDATLYIFNNKKEYKLKSGNHKFWSMKGGQVGFDMNNF